MMVKGTMVLRMTWTIDLANWTNIPLAVDMDMP